MARIKQIEPPKNDFGPDENEEILGFTSVPVTAGKCISSFSFDDDIETTDIDVTTNKTNTASIELNTIISKPAVNSTNDNNNSTSIKQTCESNNEIISDNRNTPMANGITPPIDGESLDTKRTYMLRASTVRKINELKSIHPDLNTYVSTIVDIAIAHYHDYIVNKGGSQ